MASRERRAARRRGLTLLEVLAAVAILGIVYGLLADWAIQGLLAEGEARRMLDASLLADRTLAKIEAGIDAGTLPELGTQESLEEPFAIEVAVSELDLATAGLVLDAEKSAREDEKARGRGQAPAAEGASFVAGGPQTASSLRRIDITVSWTEATRDVEVVRTTFAFDREAVRPVLDQLDADAVAQARAQLTPAGGRTGEPL